jgi:hypothetical protein
MAEQRNTARKIEPQTTPATPTRLIGWLVSYALDKQGASFEIRSGRTFVGAHELTGERAITLDERSISSAHLVLNASARHKVMIQDIFSDHGSYLRRAEGGDEQSIMGPVELRHGDWVRIGDQTRLQVCLIDASR